MERKKTEATTSFTEYLLTHYRGIFAVLVLIPLSVIYNIVHWLRLKLTRTGSAGAHNEKVKYIQQQINDWVNNGMHQRLCNSRSAWQSMSEMVPTYKLTSVPIKTDLYNVLAIDEENATVRVEPLVNMGQLSSYLLKRGWTLPVLPELDDLTVGGLIMGFGVETSSHKYGLFQYICQSFEIVTSDGKLHTCSATKNAGLFYAIPWSYGTLGFLVAATLKIIRSHKYVKAEYIPLKSRAELLRRFEEESRNTRKNEFVEGLVYSADKAVLICAQFADKPSNDGKINAIGRWYKPWFYKHAQQYLQRNETVIEYIPIRHWYHRHTRSLFWEMEQIIPFGNHPAFRWLLGWALPPRLELLKYSETETIGHLRETHHIVQDILVPVTHLDKALRYFDDHYNLYPLWLSPMCIYANPTNQGMLHPLKKEDGTVEELYVDIGAYGTPDKDPATFDANAELQALEKFAVSTNSYQALYARTLMTEQDFRQMFDHSHYDKLRNTIPNARAAFADVYQKVSKSGRTSPSGLRKMKK